MQRDLEEGDDVHGGEVAGEGGRHRHQEHRAHVKRGPALGSTGDFPISTLEGAAILAIC